MPVYNGIAVPFFGASIMESSLFWLNSSLFTSGSSLFWWNGVLFGGNSALFDENGVLFWWNGVLFIENSVLSGGNSVLFLENSELFDANSEPSDANSDIPDFEEEWNEIKDKTEDANRSSPKRFSPFLRPLFIAFDSIALKINCSLFEEAKLGKGSMTAN